MRRLRASGQRRGLRKVAAELARLGYVNDAGKPFAAAKVKQLLA